MTGSTSGRARSTGFRARARSRGELEVLQLIVNGQVVAEQTGQDVRELTLEKALRFDRSSWAAVRAFERSASVESWRPAGLVFAHTSPVYFFLEGKPVVVPESVRGPPAEDRPAHRAHRAPRRLPAGSPPPGDVGRLPRGARSAESAPGLSLRRRRSAAERSRLRRRQRATRDLVERAHRRRVRAQAEAIGVRPGVERVLGVGSGAPAVVAAHARLPVVEVDRDRVAPRQLVGVRGASRGPPSCRARRSRSGGAGPTRGGPRRPRP